jgi:hypothetical protein
MSLVQALIPGGPLLMVPVAVVVVLIAALLARLEHARRYRAVTRSSTVPSPGTAAPIEPWVKLVLCVQTSSSL